MIRNSHLTGLLVLIAIAIGFVLILSLSLQRLGPNMVDDAELQARTIAAAFHAYHARSGHWPESMNELVNPPDGGRPYLQRGEGELIDPWGQRYEYAIRSNEQGEERAVIWTTSPEGERIQWPRE
jgi:hypothetical protein